VNKMKYIINVGDKFGRLTVLETWRIKEPSGQNRYRVRVLCDCGKETEVEKDAITSGNTKSCGCLVRETIGALSRTHGKTKERIYRCWRHMIERCHSPNSERYPHYGARGIVVCSEWRNFEGFYAWASVNGYTDDLTIERIDINGNYEPSNCCFIPMSEQQSNTTRSRRLECFGETKTAAQWERDERCKVSQHTILKRVKKGWSIEDAITLESSPLSRQLRLSHKS
jgi:hypothetical protein